MIVLRFHRFGTLWSYNGIPLYIGGKCITNSRMAWWWPVNWIAVACFLPYALFKTAKRYMQ